jgi:hypothetical protein
LRRVDRAEICVTNGAISTQQGGQLAVETPSSRAVVRGIVGSSDQVAEIRFRYLGPSETGKPLASGEMRRQIGLKLQAEDTCNVVYAMWHIAPTARLVVSVKRNIGMHRHDQCGAGGYVFVRSQSSVGVAPVRPGEVNTLRAELHGDDLTVTANGKVAWRGSLGGMLPSGAMGFRTDNVRAELDYYVGGVETGLGEDHPDAGRCKPQAAD